MREPPRRQFHFLPGLWTRARGLVAFALAACFCVAQLALLRAASRTADCAVAAAAPKPSTTWGTPARVPGAAAATATTAAVGEADGRAAAQMARWELWPFGEQQPGAGAGAVRVGVVTGGTSDLFGGGGEAYGDATACLLRRLAQRRGYAFYAERALQRFGADRPVAWQKIRLLAERLMDVDLLVWVDADVAWTATEADLADVFLRELSTPAACIGHLGQSKWEGVAGVGVNSSGIDATGGIFFWASADVRPKQHNMNLNSAVIAIRSGGESRRFLAAVWEEGNDLFGFTKYNPHWRKQPVGHHYWGWPFEQGGIWAVLEREPSFLRHACVVKVGRLHSVQYWRWQPVGPLGAHMPGMTNADRRKAACKHLGSAVAEQPSQCGEMLRQCPDLFVGRLLAAHADGLCAHCLGTMPQVEANSSEDWSLFDCGCLRSA